MGIFPNFQFCTYRCIRSTPKYISFNPSLFSFKLLPRNGYARTDAHVERQPRDEDVGDLGRRHRRLQLRGATGGIVESRIGLGGAPRALANHQRTLRDLSGIRNGVWGAVVAEARSLAAGATSFRKHIFICLRQKVRLWLSWQATYFNCHIVYTLLGAALNSSLEDEHN